MPIQVKPKHHPRIATLVAQAKANDPERTWTSALLAEYVNEHYGDGIKFHTATKDKGSLTKHMTTKKLVDDDAKVGDKLKAAYGVTDLAVASMNDLTQPLYEDPHDPELVTGYASVLVDWATKLPEGTSTYTQGGSRPSARPTSTLCPCSAIWRAMKAKQTRSTSRPSIRTTTRCGTRCWRPCKRWARGRWRRSRRNRGGTSTPASRR